MLNLTMDNLIEGSAKGLGRSLADESLDRLLYGEDGAPLPEPELLHGAKEIGAFLGVSRERAQYLLECGDLPAFKLRGRWVMRPAAFRAFCEERERQHGKAG